MKKLFCFLISLSASFIFFCSVAFLCLILPNLPEKENNVSEIPQKTQATEPICLQLSVIYPKSDRLLMCDLFIIPASNEVKAKSVDLPENLSKNAQGILSQEGLYPFIGHCLASSGSLCRKYTLIDRKFLIKIADISGGIVYNDKLQGDILLPGSQTDDILDNSLFLEACRQIAERAVNGDFEEIFRLLAASTVNNLSYPEFYDAVKG